MDILSTSRTGPVHAKSCAKPEYRDNTLNTTDDLLAAMHPADTAIDKLPRNGGDALQRPGHSTAARNLRRASSCRSRSRR